MLCRCSPLVVVLLVGIAHAGDPNPARRPLSLDDLYRFDAPTRRVLAPDGKSLVYVRQWHDERTRAERNSLWIGELDAEKKEPRWRPLEEGEPDGRSPVFSPDGRWIAFLSGRPRPQGWRQTPPAPPQSDPAVDVWLIPRSGGTAIPLAGPEKSHGRVFHDGFYGRVAFSPDGRRLVFVADDGKDPRTAQERENEVRIARPDQGEGYTGYGTAQLWLAHLDEKPQKSAAVKIDRLTSDDVWYGDPQWSPDGKFLVVHANRTEDRESVRYSINKNYDLWALDLDTHRLRQLTTGPGPEVSPRFSPDGKRLVCLSVPRKGSHRDVFNLAVVTLGPGGPRTEILFDQHGPGADQPPHPPAFFPLPDDCWDGAEHLIYTNERGTGSEMIRLEVRTRKGAPLDRSVIDPVTSVRRPQARGVSLPGNRFLQERALGESKVISWASEDGQKIEGVLTLPPAGVTRAPYPLVVYPHGGPHSRSVLGFNFTVEIFAAHGYAVFQPNFRGSSGYGQKFIDADRFDLGGGDMRDILSGIDHLVKEKVADRNRQFVYGTSYGGFMTTWLVGHTQQFRAAVAQNPVTDMTTMWSLSDLQSWTEWELGGKPWEVPAAYRKHSPLTHAANVRTPTLILHAREDRRCPLPMGQMFHQALKARGVPTQLVIYPGEGHGIKQPRHRMDVLQRTLAWFEQHDVKGKR